MAAWTAQNCRLMLTEGVVLVTMNFSKNYWCCFKDEVQLGYFDQMQVTIYPMMAYYWADGRVQLNMPSLGYAVILDTLHILWKCLKMKPWNFSRTNQGSGKDWKMCMSGQMGQLVNTRVKCHLQTSPSTKAHRLQEAILRPAMAKDFQMAYAP